MSAKLAPNGVTRERVFEYILAEVDLEGVFVMPMRSVAEDLGTSTAAIRYALEGLVLEGRISHAGRYVRGGRGSSMLQFSVAEEYL